MEKLEKRLRARDFAPVRAALLLLGLLIALSVQLLRQSEGAMLWIYSHNVLVACKVIFFC